MRTIRLDEFMPRRLPSVNPAKFQSETFELWSVPSFDVGAPEVLFGSEIGSSKKVVEKGDLLLSRIVPHIRRAWIVEPTTSNRQIGSGEWITFRSNDFYAPYLRHILISDKFNAQLMQTIAGVGGSLLRARPESVRDIEVPLPPLPEQKRIAGILDQADALRRQRQRALDHLNQLGQSIFYEMFDGSSEKVDFETLVFFQEGPGVRKWQFRDAGVKLINVRNIQNGQLNLSNTSRFLEKDEAHGKYRHFLLEKGDLVVASSGVTWGKIAEVSEQHLPLCLNTSMIRLRAKSDDITKSYIRAFVELGSFREQINRIITGSAQPNFGPSHLKQLLMPKPSKPKLEKFEKVIESLDREKYSQIKNLKLSENLFASLQQRAFRGEL